MRKPKPQQRGMFDESLEDLPLWSGVAQRVLVDEFVARPVQREVQENMDKEWEEERAAFEHNNYLTRVENWGLTGR